MRTVWSKVYVENLLNLAETALDDMSETEERYGMSWRELSNAVLLLDSIRAIPADEDGRIRFDLSESAAESLKALQHAMPERRS